MRVDVAKVIVADLLEGFYQIVYCGLELLKGMYNLGCSSSQIQGIPNLMKYSMFFLFLCLSGS